MPCSIRTSTFQCRRLAGVAPWMIIQYTGRHTLASKGVVCDVTAKLFWGARGDHNKGLQASKAAYMENIHLHQTLLSGD